METHIPKIFPAAKTVNAKVGETSRLLFIDNIRIYLTILVIAHHLMIIYTDSGGWIYHEGRQDEITSILGGWFCAVNQAYFMGLFLLIAANFVPGDYDRKGQGKFLVDRLVRLGIPLVFYSWVLRPLLIFLGEKFPGSFWTWYRFIYFKHYGFIGGGPVWFIEILLIFSVIYAILRSVMQRPIQKPMKESKFPGSRKIVLFTLILGSVSFFIRIFTRINESYFPLNLQFANIAQYTALFVVGLVAYRQDWLTKLPDPVGKKWLRVAIFIIIIYAPLGLLTLSFGEPDSFLGGRHWQSMAFSQWESFLCVSACIGLIYLFRRKLNQQGIIAKELSRSAYATYLLHEPVITFLAIFTEGLIIYPLLKFVIAVFIMTPICFLVGGLVRRIPYVGRVL